MGAPVSHISVSRILFRETLRAIASLIERIFDSMKILDLACTHLCIDEKCASDIAQKRTCAFFQSEDWSIHDCSYQPVRISQCECRMRFWSAEGNEPDESPYCMERRFISQISYSQRVRFSRTMPFALQPTAITEATVNSAPRIIAEYVLQCLSHNLATPSERT